MIFVFSRSSAGPAGCWRLQRPAAMLAGTHGHDACDVAVGPAHRPDCHHRTWIILHFVYRASALFVINYKINALRLVVYYTNHHQSKGVHIPLQYINRPL